MAGCGCCWPQPLAAAEASFCQACCCQGGGCFGGAGCSTSGPRACSTACPCCTLRFNKRFNLLWLRSSLLVLLVLLLLLTLRFSFLLLAARFACFLARRVLSFLLPHFLAIL